jgi:exonuclease III
MRAGNKVFNRGLRLDYVLTSSQLAVRDATVFPQLLDAFVHDEDELLHGLSDHCPVGVLLAV